MRDYTEHLIKSGSSLKEALSRLDALAADAILFIVDENKKLLGSLTDGDVRRGLLNNLDLKNNVDDFLQPNPRYVRKSEYTIDDIIHLREKKLKIIPVLNDFNEIINLINFRYLQSYLPLDALIMAGGKGTRLKPLTDNVPKPLLKVGDKPIIEHNIDRLRKFGVDDFWISLRYLGEQIEGYFQGGENKSINIKYIYENQPLGTLGAVSLVEDFKHNTLLVTNSDILTTMDYEDFYLDFLRKDADMSVATIPYNVDVPYAILETSEEKIFSFREKPTYTYYANAGIYLLKKDILNFIPKNTFYNSTDLMEELLKQKKHLISYPVRQYWLDIGKPKDFEKAQEDINHIKL